MEAIAVDWSGAQKGGHIWWAGASDSRLIDVARAPSREAAIDHVIDHARRTDEPLVVGLDFAFSFPAWFLESRDLQSAPELWTLAASDGEAWLDACERPFWGRPGRKRPELAQHLRRTEAGCEAVAGIRPKSVFQIGGAGAVGTGSVRGMPFLHRLAEAGFAIWPFDAPTDRLVVEIYPRLLTGAVVKRSLAARQAYLDRLVRAGELDTDQAAVAVQTEDAFDAAVSALVMSAHTNSFARLARATDSVIRLEGEMWVPPAAPVPATTPATEPAPPTDTKTDTEAGAGKPPAYSPRYAEALGYAARLHVTQRRKGTSVPYLSHLLSVSALVWEAGGDEDQAIAALLHDAVEDRGGEPTLAAIRTQFGTRVADIVESCTDSYQEPKPPWRARKEAHLARLRTASPDVLLVVAADKLHNATSTVEDLRRDGSAVWDRFRGGRDGTLWYYRQMTALLSERLSCPLVSRLADAVTELDRLG